MAVALRDHSLAEEFISGADPHLETARGIYGRQNISDEERQVGKVMNFSMVYGGGMPTLLRQGVAKDFPEAKRLLNAFHSARPGVGRLQRLIKARIEQRGYVTTLWGRHLHVQEDHKGLNALIQGTAAELMRDAMRKTSRWFASNPDYRSHIVNAVHDELQIDARQSEVPVLVKVIPELMDHGPISEVVPVETDVEVSTTNWAEKQPWPGPPVSLTAKAA
jgi:DNA polymerase-1